MSKPDVSFRIKSDGGIFQKFAALKRLPDDPEALMQGGLVLEREIKVNITRQHLIDTGKMRASVAALIINARKIIVAVRTFYAIFHEYGTRYMKARPFARPAVDTHGKQAGAAVAAYFRDKIKRLAR